MPDGKSAPKVLAPGGGGGVGSGQRERWKFGRIRHRAAELHRRRLGQHRGVDDNPARVARMVERHISLKSDDTLADTL